MAPTWLEVEPHKEGIFATSPSNLLFSYSFIFALLPFLSVGVNCESKGQYQFNLALLANALVPLGAKHLASWPIRRRCSCVKGKEEQERVRKRE